MNPVAEYIKNLGKSVVYSTLEHVSTKAPAAASFAESNQDLYKEVYHGIRDYRTTIERTKEVIKNSTVYRLSDMAFSNAIEDIKSGKIYNKEREDAAFDFGGGEDFSSPSDADVNFDEPTTSSGTGVEIGSGDKAVIQAVKTSSDQSTQATIGALEASAKYITNTNKDIANMQFAQSSRVLNTMQVGFGNLAASVDSLYKFNTEVITTHADNSRKFFENATGLLQKQTAILEEMVQMQRESYKKELEKEKEEKANRFDDIVNANGTPDLKAYMKAVGGNFKTAVNDQSGGMLSMLSEDNLKMLASNPLAFIPQMLISAAMGAKLNTAIEKFDKTLSGAFSAMTARFSKMGKDTDASDFDQFLGKVFGLKNDVKTSIDTSKFDKGPMPYNGLANKSIIEVIPGHLRRIEALMSGGHERYYDNNTGKWTDAKSIKTSFENIRKSNVSSAFSDVTDEMKDMLKAVTFQNRKEQEDFLKDMQNILEKIYDDHGDFNPNDKSEWGHMKYGASSASNYRMFQQMYKNMSRGTTMNVARNVQSQREMENRYTNQLEKEGTSLYNNLSNGYGMDSHIKVDEKTNEIKKKYGNLGDTMNLLKIEDPFKKNIFDYLRAINNELFIIRKTGGFGGDGGAISTSSKVIKRRGKQHQELNIPEGNPIFFTDDEWKKYFENLLGEKEKSAKQKAEDEEKQKDESWNAAKKRRIDEAKSKGRELTEVNKYMDEEELNASGAAFYKRANDNDIMATHRMEQNNTNWLSEIINDSAKGSKKRLQEEASVDSKESFLDQLIHAGSLGAKWDVLRNGIDKLTSKPTDILTGVLTSADKQIYNFFYGQETDVKDDRGNKIKGFFNRMTWEMQRTFGKVNDWLDESVLKPFRDKFGGKDTWEAGKNALKNVGIDVDAMTGKAKDFFGDILRPTKEAIENTFRDAYEEVKRDMAKSYKDANQFYKNTVLGEQTTEQKISSAKRLAGVDNFSEEDAYRQFLLNDKNSSYTRHKERQTGYQNKMADLERAIQQETNPKRKAGLLKTLAKYNETIQNKNFNTDPRIFLEQEVAKYKSRKQKLSKVSSQIDNYENTNEDQIKIKSRERFQNRLNTIKQELDITGDLGSINLESEDYFHLTNPENLEKFNEALSLEKRIPNYKTGLERLVAQKQALEKEHNNSWGTYKNAKEAINDPRLLLAQAQSNLTNSKWVNFEDRSKGATALQQLLGINQETPKTKEVYQTVQELAKEYVKSASGLGKGDPLKNLKIQINRANNNGNEQEVSALTQKMNDIIASKAALIGRYTNNFSTCLGKMGVSAEYISETVEGIIDSHKLEELESLNNNIDSFIDAAIKTNPNLASVISYYKSNNTANRLVMGLSDSAKINQSIIKSPQEPMSVEQFIPEGNKFTGGSYEKNPSEITEEFLRQRSLERSANPTPQYSKGSLNIPKTGLAILSQGEAVIPSDENPFNPDINTADRKRDAKNEQIYKNQLSKDLDVSNIPTHADGTTSFDGSKDGAIIRGINNAKSGLGNFFDQIFNSKESQMKMDKVGAEIKTHLPKGIAGGALGAVTGLLTGIGGPLLGAIAGSAISIVSNSETFQRSLFGDKVLDANGEDTGKREGGLFSSEVQETVKKYLPDAKAYGITGTILGLVTPLGPLGGLMMGSAIAFAKNNETVQQHLFGKTGLINDETKESIRKMFPNMAVGALAGLFLGPFGMVGNAALGSAVGLVTTTDEFKDFMLGKEDATGKRVGGVAGAIKNSLVDPLAKFASTIQSTFFNFVKKDIADPLKGAMAPLGKQLYLAINDTVKFTGKTISYLFKSSLGIPLIQKLITPVKMALSPFVNPAKKIASGALTGLGKVVSAPAKIVGKFGDWARENQIRKSNADYMTASERLEFMANTAKRGYALQGYDEVLAGSKKDKLEDLSNALGSIRKGREHLDQRHDEYQKDLRDTVMAHGDKYKWDHYTSRSILKAARDGDMEQVHHLIQESNLSTAEKEKLAKQINSKSDRLRTLNQRRDNYTDNQDEMFKELETKFDIKGINKNNIKKYQSVLETEIASRRDGTDNTAEGKEYAVIETSLDTNTEKLVAQLKKQESILEQIRDTAAGISPEQREKLNRMRQNGEDYANLHKERNDKDALERNSAIEEMYGKKLNDRHKYTLLDNDKKFNEVRRLAKGGYKFGDLDKLLDYDEDTFKRFVALAETGYVIKDYDKLSKMSQSGFNNVLAYTQTGAKITDIDRIINADPKVIKGMIELREEGFNDVSQHTLEKMTKKKSQFIKNKDEALDKMDSVTNPDNTKVADTLEQSDTENTHDYRSRFQKIKDAAKGKMNAYTNKLSKMAHNLMNGGKEVQTTENDVDLIAAAVLSVGDTVAERIAKASQGTPKDDKDSKNDSKEVMHVPTEYGIETYTESTDGSKRMAPTKDNKEIQAKIEARDATQRGIFSSLSYMVKSAKEKVKNGLKKVKEKASGGFDLLKTLFGGAKGLLDLPYKLFGLGKDGKFGNSKLGKILYNTPLTALIAAGKLAYKGAGLAKDGLSWAGDKIGAGVNWVNDKTGGAISKVSSAVKDKFGWVGDKVGGAIDWTKDTLSSLPPSVLFDLGRFGMKGLSWAGGKIGEKFGNTKFGKAIGNFFGSKLTAGEDPISIGDAQPEEVSAFNSKLIVNRLDKLAETIEANSGGKGGLGGTGVDAGDIADAVGDSNLKEKGKGLWNKTKNFLKGNKKLIGKGALFAGAAYLATNLMSPSGAEAATMDGGAPDGLPDNIPTDNTNKGLDVSSMALSGLSVMTTGTQLSNNPALMEKAQVFLAKAKDGLKSLVDKIGKWIPSKSIYEAVQKFCAKLMEKMSTPQNLIKIATKLGAKLALGPAYIAAGVATAGVGDIVLGAAESVGWFLHGWSNANEMLGVKSGATTGMKFAAGLVEAVVTMIPVLGIVIPSDYVLGMAIDIIGPPFGFNSSDVEKLKQTNEKADKDTQAAINTANAGGFDDDNSNDPNSNNKGFIEKAWDDVKSFGSSVWDKMKSTGNFLMEKGSDAVKKAKQIGTSMVDWVKTNYQAVKDKASNLWSSVKDGASYLWDKVTGNNSGTGKNGPSFDMGKYGRSKYGRGLLGSSFKSQLDPQYDMSYNAKGDTMPQTMEDSGCGPVSLTNMAGALGVNIDPRQAASYALSKGYKEKDGGTEPGYFGDLLGKYGIGTEKVQSPKDIKDNLTQGNPVLLMGKDGRGVNPTNPYGQYNHYVVGTGMDDKGNIVVQDPESNIPDQLYKANDVLGKSSLAIAAAKNGMGKFLNRFGKGKWGRGGDLSPEHMWALANWVSKQTGVKPEFVYGQWYHESGGFSSQLAKENYNFGGMTQSEPTGDPADKQPGGDGGNYYMHFQSPEEWAEYYTKYIGKLDNPDAVKNAANVQDFAQALKNEGYYGASVDEYINGVSGGIAQIPGKYDESLVDSSKFNTSSSSGSNNKNNNKTTNTKKNTGFLGKLSELYEIMGNSFNVATGGLPNTGKGKFGRGKWGRGEDVPQKIWDFLKTKGMSSTAIAGIMGNIQQESTFDPLADNGTHRGICQWDKNDRYAKMAQTGDPDSLDTQLNFMWQEMNDRGLVDKLNNTPTIEEAARIWDEKFEVSGGSEIGQRVSYGENIFNTIGQGKPFNGSATNSSSSGSTNSKSNNTKKNTGFFGKLSEIYETMGNAFNVATSSINNTGKGKWGRGDDIQQIASGQQQPVIPTGGPGLPDTSLQAITEPQTTTPTTTDVNTTTQTPTNTQQATQTNNTTQTASSSGGILDSILNQAKTMSGKMQKAMGPLAGAITSTAAKVFGLANIKAIFGDNNPFANVFGNKDKNSNSKSSGPNTNFSSSSTDAGIRTASAWAQSLVDSNEQQGYGPSGCTAFAQDYLKHAGNPLADNMPANGLLWTPTLMKWAQDNKMWKGADQPGSEGDLALLNTDDTPSDPDHTVVSDGNGGYFGNSSSTLKIAHSGLASDFGADNLFGYVATGVGDGKVAEGRKTSTLDVKATAGPTSGGGKYGRSKFGIGRYGRGTFPYTVQDVDKYTNNQYSGNESRKNAMPLSNLYDEDENQYNNILSQAKNLTEQQKQPVDEQNSQSFADSWFNNGRGFGRYGRSRYGRGAFPYTIQEVATYMNNQCSAEDSRKITSALYQLANDDYDQYNNILDRARNLAEEQKSPVNDQDSQEFSNSWFNNTGTGKNGRGILDSITNSIKKISNDFSDPFGPPQQPKESISDKVQRNIIDINALPKGQPEIVPSQQVTQQPTAISNQTKQQTSTIDYTEKFDTIISLLSTIASALTGVQVNAQQNNQQSKSNQSTGVNNIIAKLGGSNSGFGDSLASKSTESIINAMRLIVQN